MTRESGTLSTQFKKFVVGLIEQIPEENITESMYNECQNMFESIKKMDDVGVGGAVTSRINCAVCGGHYKPKYKHRHFKTQKHIIEDAKDHQMYDYVNRKIIDPRELFSKKVSKDLLKSK